MKKRERNLIVASVPEEDGDDSYDMDVNQRENPLLPTTLWKSIPTYCCMTHFNGFKLPEQSPNSLTFLEFLSFPIGF